MDRTHKPHMSLGWLIIPGGNHRASWQLYTGQPDPNTDFEVYVKMAREAEEAGLDYIFHADWPSIRPGPRDIIARNFNYNNHIEPIPLMSALAAVTSRIGLVGTSSTTHNEPYNLARQFAALDHISHGRAGWNIVTSRSPIAALNYGHEAAIPHAERYRRSHEFVDVVTALWDSYDDDAFIRDPVSGYYFTPDKLHTLDHEGKYFRVKGPLNIARSPQGQPVRFQAGASDDGMELAARVGEMVFCIFGEMEAMRNYRRTIKEKAVGYGRDPDDVLVSCGFDVIVRESSAEAEDAFEELQAMLHPEAIKDVVSNDIEADISDLGLDDLVTIDRLPKDANSSKSADKLIRSWLQNEPMTVRQLFDRFSRSRSAMSIHGNPMQIADKMEEWFRADAVDGFMLFFMLETGMRDFGRLVIPELQRRGLFRTRYEGVTLRDHLGLRRPISRYEASDAPDDSHMSRQAG